MGQIKTALASYWAAHSGGCATKSGATIFAHIKPLIPDWAISGVPLAEILRQAQTWVPFVLLILIGTGLFLNQRRRLLALATQSAEAIPPIKVEILSRWQDQAAAKAAETFAAEARVVWKMQAQPLYKYDAKIHIVNLSKTERVSLKLAGYTVEMPNGAPGETIHGGIKSDGLKLSLSPQEETEGIFSVNLSAPYHSNGKHKLIIVDRISDGIARVPVLGKYPAK
jgi:hypothetical protein